jgi:hypothetical protein
VRWYRLLGLLALLALLMASCNGGQGGERSLAEGDEAPSFTLASAAGGKVALSDFSQKKPVLLDFSMGPG